MTSRPLSLSEALMYDHLKPCLFADEPTFVVDIGMLNMTFANAAAYALLNEAMPTDIITQLSKALDDVQNQIETLWPCTLEIGQNSKTLVGQWTVRQTRLTQGSPKRLVFTRKTTLQTLSLESKMALYWHNNITDERIEFASLYELDTPSPQNIAHFSKTEALTPPHLIEKLSQLEYGQVLPLETASSFADQQDNENPLLIAHLSYEDKPLGLIIGSKENLAPPIEPTNNTQSQIHNAPSQQEASPALKSLDNLVSGEDRIAAFVDHKGEILALSSLAQTLEGNDKLIFSDLVAEMTNPIAKTRLNDKHVTLQMSPGHFQVTIEEQDNASSFDYRLALSPIERTANGETAANSKATETPQNTSDSLPFRFIFRTDEQNLITSISNELTEHWPSIYDWLIGKSLDELAKLNPESSQQNIPQLISLNEHWGGLTIDINLDDLNMITVELCGLPAIDNTNQFLGFSGFGLCYETPQPLPSTATVNQTATTPNNHQVKDDTENNDTLYTLSERERANFNSVGKTIKQGIATNHTPTEKSTLDQNENQDENTGIKETPEITDTTPPETISNSASADTSERNTAANNTETTTKGVNKRLKSQTEAVGLFQNGTLIEASPALLTITAFENIQDLSAALTIEGLSPIDTKEDNDVSGLMLLPHQQSIRLMIKAKLHLVTWQGQSSSLIIFERFDSNNAQSVTAILSPLDMACDGYIILDSDDFIEQVSPKLARTLLWRSQDLIGRAIQVILSRESDLDWQKNSEISSPEEALPSHPEAILKLVDRSGESHYFQMTETEISLTRSNASNKHHKQTRLFAFHKLNPQSMLTRLQNQVNHDLKSNLATTTALIDDLGDELSLPISRLVAIAGELRLRLGENEQTIQPLAMAMVRSAMNLKTITSQLQAIRNIRQEPTQNPLEDLSLTNLANEAIQELDNQLHEAELLLRTSFQPDLPALKLDAERTRELINQIMLYTLSQAKHEDMLILSIVAKDKAQVLRIRFGPRQSQSHNENTSVEIKKPTGDDGIHNKGLASVVNLTLARTLASALGAHLNIRHPQGIDFLIEVTFPASRTVDT